MKILFLSLLLSVTLSYNSFGQTTLTEDANGVLNATKLVTQTSAGQIFYTGHQLGTSYGLPFGIFRAITDNTGGGNYFYDGLSGTTTTFSVRSDGQGYFATNVGIGTTTPIAQLHIFGAGQNTSALSTSTGMGGTLYLQDSGTGGGNGGAVIFGIGTGAFAAIKGFGTYGNSNTQGDLTFSTRAVSTDATLTERMRLLSNGAVGIGTVAPGSYLLAVNGGIHAKQVNIDMTGWSDYVFKPAYHLPSLQFVKSYINLNHHLPEIPSEQEIATNGLNLGDIDRLLTKKVEELTLYLIEKDQKDKEQQQQIDLQQKTNTTLVDQLKLQQEQIDQLKQQLNILVKSINILQSKPILKTNN